MKTIRYIGTAVAALLFSVTGAAAVDCSNEQTQAAMNACTYQDYQDADAELNRVFKEVRDTLKSWDRDLPDDYTGVAKPMLDAQRLWIKFRDAHCDTVGNKYEGGTIRPSIVNGCLAAMTRARTKQLTELTEDN